MTTLVTYPDITQGTPEWEDARRGMVTASVVGQLITVGSPDATAVECPTCEAPVDEPCMSAARKTPTPMKTVHAPRAERAATLPPVYRTATGDTPRTLRHLLLAERVTGYTDPTFTSYDMERGIFDEPRATEMYAEHHAPVDELGFMHREFDVDGTTFKIGLSPDGLVGDDGGIEIKSRRQKKQFRTVVENIVPPENMVQVQCALLVSGRSWWDYISYAGGMAFWVQRVTPDPAMQSAIVVAVADFEQQAAVELATYRDRTDGLPLAQRLTADDLEMVI